MLVKFYMHRARCSEMGVKALTERQFEALVNNMWAKARLSV